MLSTGLYLGFTDPGLGQAILDRRGCLGPLQQATFLQITTSASAGLARSDFPTLAEDLHAMPLSFSNKGRPLLEDEPRKPGVTSRD